MTILKGAFQILVLQLDDLKERTDIEMYNNCMSQLLILTSASPDCIKLDNGLSCYARFSSL